MNWHDVSRPLLVGLALAGAGLARPASAQSVVSAARAPFPNFESGPVNALLLAPDGTRLYVLNTSDGRVEVWSTGTPPATRAPRGASAGRGATAGPLPGAAGPAGGPPAPAASPGAAPPLSKGVALQYVGAVFTGLEPVAMALHPDDANTLFVANHVSDSVAVLDLPSLSVRATIAVGDEPQGLVVAGGTLFVACARAPDGPVPPAQLVPAPQVAHVVVARSAQPPYGHLATLPIGAVKPRDLVAVDDTVFVIAQNSGNRTTILDETAAKQLGLEQEVPDAFDAPFSVNPVLLRPEWDALPFTRGWYIPNAGRIVFDSEYPALVPQLADRDVVGIDVETLTVLPGATTGVGTTLFDIERSPSTGRLWVAATEARNRTRFEPVLRGAALENRVAIVAPGGAVQQILTLAPPFTQAAHAQPAVIAFGQVGATPLAAVACLGSASVVLLDGASGALLGEFATGEIPSGLALDSSRGVLWVYARGDHALRAHDLSKNGALLGPPRPLAVDPEPPAVRAGRRHLYDARASSGHGTGNMSCASCHVYAHDDHLAWDLGDPGGSFAYYFPDVLGGLASFTGQIVTAPTTPILSPLKGPMVTQSLRGLLDPDTKDDLPLHWRGDRRTLHQFRGAFSGLLGGAGLSPAQMQSFAVFVRSLRYAPNPLQPKDRHYTGLAATGKDTYGLTPGVPGKDYVAGSGFVCASCHLGEFEGKSDFTGGRPVASSGSFTQLFQTAQLRFIYEKDDKFVSGFGALHDGAVDGVRGFMDFVVPNGGLPTFSNFTTADKDAVAEFVKAWDTGLAPLVGAQWTLDAGTTGEVHAVLDLYEAQARPPAGNVDLIVKGRRLDLDEPRGAHYRFDPDLGAWGYRFDTGAFVDRTALLAAVNAGIARFTFTCVPPGQGERLGLDRDEDGAFDFAEVLAGTDPDAPDTDGDGWLDGDEPALGGDPLLADTHLPDGVPPTVLSPRALEIFVDTATLSFRTDEPAQVLVELGLSAGSWLLPAVDGPPGLARTHDVVLTGLPAGSEIFWRVTATDRAGNAGSATGSFTTLPLFVHVGELTLEASGSGPFSPRAVVRVLDHADQPVAGAPVRGFWAGDLGGQPWEQVAISGADGRAEFLLQPYTPAAPTTIAFMPGYIGSPFPSAGAWFVGLGGGAAGFFYDQTRNVAGHVVLELP